MFNKFCAFSVLGYIIFLSFSPLIFFLQQFYVFEYQNFINYSLGVILYTLFVFALIVYFSIKNKGRSETYYEYNKSHLLINNIITFCLGFYLLNSSLYFEANSFVTIILYYSLLLFSLFTIGYSIKETYKVYKLYKRK